MRKFREAVQGIKEDSTRVKMQIAYLLAARNCEIITKVSEKELLGHRSRNYGVFMHMDFRDFIIQPKESQSIQLGLKESFQQKVLVVRLAVAKRGKRVRTKDRGNENLKQVTAEETEKALTTYKQNELLKKWRAGQVTIDPLLIKVLNGNVHLRYVALPCSTDYESWILDILKWRKTYGGTQVDWISIVKTDDGGYALAGWTDSFGGGGEDVYLVKTESSPSPVHDIVLIDVDP